MARKLYGSARAVSNIGSLQVGTSSYPAVSAVNKATFVSKINSTKAVRDKIIAGDDITGASFEITQSGSNWNGYVAIDFGGTIVKSGATGVSVDAAVAFLESWGGTVITPVTRSLYSPLTLTDITYGNGTRQIKKLYGAVSEPVYQAEQPTLIEDNGAGQFINQSQFDLDKLGAYFKSINCQIGVDYRMVLWGYSGSAGLWIGDPNSQTMDTKNPVTIEELATLGISATTGLYTAPGNVSFRVRIHQNGTETLSKEIKKLYGAAEAPAYVSSQPQMTADQGMGQYIDQNAFDLSKLGDAIAAGGGHSGTYYQMNIWYIGSGSNPGFGIWVGNPGTIIMQTALSRAALAEYGVTTNATPSSDTGNAEFRVSIRQNGTKSVTKLLLDNS